MGKNGLPTGSIIQSVFSAKRQLGIASYILLLSALFVPAHARAGFFSNLAKFFLPDSATAVQPELPAASISLPLLGSNQVGQQPDNEDSDNKKIDPDQSPLSVMQDNALVGSLNPLGVMSENGQDKIVAYLVQPGDTGRGIANKFGISFNTLLWANDLKSSSEIKAGDSLVILPVSGIQYDVRKGDSIDSIVKKFKPKDMTDETDILSFKADILSFNNLAVNEDIEAGSTILIPDGELIAPPAPSKSPRSPAPSSGNSSRFANLPEYRGYYMRPVIGGRRSRGVHGYNGVDLANSCGLPVLASANGTVIIARTSGWNGGYGKYVVINHGNGTQTLYAHMSALFAVPGQHVDQGVQIGNIGSTGNSTGCHVHFEIRGARNPF
ncbi:MAG: peptidoglycan DD-metalloendopeptidase family protein [Candidatus Sungbacteria bacterium]|nr:peptidoglycan DD-metalloendopeptidase family protein [Candidatus Sungbacteria bacterium]